MWIWNPSFGIPFINPCWRHSCSDFDRLTGKLQQCEAKLGYRTCFTKLDISTKDPFHQLFHFTSYFHPYVHFHLYSYLFHKAGHMKASFSFNSFTFTFDFILISIFYFYLFHKAAHNLILKQDIFHQLLSTFYNITFTLEFRYQFQKSGIIYQSRTFVSLQKNTFTLFSLTLTPPCIISSIQSLFLFLHFFNV